MISVLWNIFASNWYLFLLTAVLAYLLGSINPAVIITRICTGGKKDIREMGSGNAGFTNVLRSVGKVPAIITLICDAMKCIAAVYLAVLIFSFVKLPVDDEWFSRCFTACIKYFAGIFCILGHSFPVYFRFKGGKGIVSAAALMLASDWRVFLMILATWAVIFVCSKIISLASIISAILYAPYAFLVTFVFDHLLTKPCLWYVFAATFSAFLIGIFVTVKHKDNIKRLLKGEEKKIHAKKAS